jgi:hypothetical protein
MGRKTIGLIIGVLIIAILFGCSANTVVYISPSPLFIFQSIEPGSDTIRGGQAVVINVVVKNVGNIEATATIIAKSRDASVVIDMSSASVTLAPGETKSVKFGAWYGGADSGKATIVFELYDTMGNLQDTMSITLKYAPPLPALFLGVPSVGRIESGKWVDLKIPVINRQAVTYEAEVRVEAPSPFRVESKGIIKSCDSSGGVFIFQITVDTLSEVTGTLIVKLYYEGELLDEARCEVAGYPPREEERSVTPSDSLLFIVMLIITILIVIVSIYLIIERRRRSIYTPIPPPPPAYYCPTCGNPLTYMPRYRRWYCHNCRKYV